MLNTTVILKTQQRLNKLASADFDNIPKWQIVEAFNKGVVSWCRRQLHGMNTKQEGDEQSKRRIDDLQILLTEAPMNADAHGHYVETVDLPANYFEWKGIHASGNDECCEGKRPMIIYLAEVANVSTLLRDKHKQPNFPWGETFCTLQNNKVRIYTNAEFTLTDVLLSYYRQPRRIEINGVSDPYTNIVSTQDIECEFKDDIIELFIDEAAKILAGDIESINQQQTAAGQVEGNN